MSTPYIGEIRMFSGIFAPVDWLLCDGSLLQISEYDVLFSLIGTTYGGDGAQTFGIPDLRGRLPVHQGNGRVLGELGGIESVTLTLGQLPQHTHNYGVDNNGGTTRNPQNAIFGATPTDRTPYTQFESPVDLGPATSSVGNTQPHANVMPFLAINFIIAYSGIFPPRS